MYDQESIQQLQFTNPQSTGLSSHSITKGGSFIDESGAGLNRISYRPDNLSERAFHGSNIHSNIQELSPTSRYEVSQAKSVSGNILDTVQSPSGGRVKAINGDALVTYQGMQTSIDALVQAGVLGLRQDGSYFEIGTDGSYSQPQKELQREPEVNSDLLPPDQEQLLNQIIEPLPQQAYDSAIQQMIINEGDVSKVRWNELSAISGVDAQQMEAQAGLINKMMEAKGLSVLNEAGLGTGDVPDFLKWARESRPTEYLRARQALFGVERSAKEAKALATEYLSKVAPIPSAEDFESSGYITRRGNQGETLVMVEGQWHQAEMLVRRGLVKRST